jgi:glycosyltransferase involved in cell wall biosynthesis
MNGTIHCSAADPVPVLVVSLMHRRGETGVQTHINDVLQYLEEQGYNPQFVGPEVSLWRRKKSYYAIRILSRVFPRQNRLKIYLSERILARVLRAELRSRLQRHSSWTVYAQDPVCTLAALFIKANQNQRVVLAVHFNLSQADEMANRGMVRVGDWLYRRTQQQEREALTRADGVLYFSRFMEEQIRSRGIIPRSSIVIPHSTRVPQPERATEPRDLIAIGTLEPRKNQSYLLEVLYEAGLRGCRYHLTVVGSGEDKARLEGLVCASDWNVKWFSSARIRLRLPYCLRIGCLFMQRKWSPLELPLWRPLRPVSRSLPRKLAACRKLFATVSKGISGLSIARAEAPIC